MSIRVPSYRRHASGQAFVQIRGKRIYLGVHGSEVSKERYRRLIAERFSGRCSDPIDTGPSITIAILVSRYKQHCESSYVKDGRPTSEVDNIRQSLKFMRSLYDHLQAAEFGPKALKAVRQQMIKASRARSTINNDVGRIRAMFKWAVAEELVSPSVLHGLQAAATLLRPNVPGELVELLG